MWILSSAWECPSRFFGGLGTVISRLLPALTGLGHRVIHVCTEGGRRRCFYYSGALCYSPHPTLAPLGYIGRAEMTVLSSICHQFVSGVDVLMAHDYHSAGCVFVAKEEGVKSLFFSHLVSDPLIEAAVYESADVVYANSRRTAETILKLTPSANVKVIHYPPPYSLIERRRGFRKSSRVLIFTRHQANKDPGWVLEVLDEVWRRKGGFTVTLAGRGTEEYRLKYKYKWLTIIGGVSEADKIKLYMNSDLLIYPSISEPYGLVPLESIALGTPALISASAGVSEAITRGHIYPGDREKTREVIEQYVNNPDELRKLLEEQRACEVMRKKWRDLAEEVLKGA